MATKNKPRIVSGHIDYKVAKHLSPVWVSNKYTQNDYDYMEQVWAGSLAGKALDTKIGFVIGGGFKPVLRLKHERGLDELAIKNKLAKYDELVDKLVEIDNQPNLNLKQTIKDATRMAKVFGRCAIVFEPVSELGNDEVGQIPTSLKIIHPKDLGTVDIDQETWQVLQVQNYVSKSQTKAHDMIYIVNMPNSPIYKSMHYGFSELQRVIGSSRALTRIIEYDMPEIAQAMWAGYKMIIVNTEGRGTPTSVLNTVLDGLKPGAFNAIAAKPEDINVIDMDLQPKVVELTQLVDLYERLIIGNFAVPGPLLGREEESNMATLFGKIRLFEAGPVAEDREWLGEILAKQWYERNLKILGGEEILNDVYISVEFEPLILESWQDTLESVQRVKNLFPAMPDNVLLDLSRLSQYKDDLADNKEEFDQKEREKLQLQFGNQGVVNELKKLNAVKSKTASVDNNHKTVEYLAKIVKLLENESK